MPGTSQVEDLRVAFGGMAVMTVMAVKTAKVVERGVAICFEDSYFIFYLFFLCSFSPSGFGYDVCFFFSLSFFIYSIFIRMCLHKSICPFFVHFPFK